jgi:uncharacterized protein (DUF4415 family)
MNVEYLNKLTELEYAELEENQEKRLRELEKKFNEEFETEYYFMVMKRDNK